MKWIKKVWGLFVDDPLLALLGLVALAAGSVAAKIGARDWAGLVVFLVIVVAMTVSVRRD
jgi:hypothetical protein